MINYASELLSCIKAKSFRQIQQIHAQILITSLFSDTHLANLTVEAYFKCGESNIAFSVFDQIPKRDACSWSPVIAFCSQNNKPEEALHFFRLMNQEGGDPNRSSLISCLNACGNLSKWVEGKQIHTQVLKKMPPSDVIVGNVLIDFYSKCGKLSEAAQAFDEIPIKDSVSWNSLLSGYSRNGRSGEAWKLFSIMNDQGMEFSHQTFSIAAKVCGELEDIKQGEQFHCLVLKTGFDSHLVVSSALLDMYVKLGYISWARKVFNAMAETNVVSWTSIISGYVHIDEGEEALKLFKQQTHVGVLPDAHSISSILAACANIPALEFGKLVHACIVKLGYEFQIFAGNSLVAMYSRCGCLFDAQRTLHSMSLKNVITWTSIIAGYAQHGKATEALGMFDRMKEAGVEPNSITFVAVLSACSRAGLVEEGRWHFQSMGTEYGLEAKEEHYACMVDLLARAGLVHEAEEFMRQMPFKPSASTLGALLNGCRANRELDLGLKCAEELFVLEPKSASNHIVLANMYAANGRWEEMRRIRSLMKEKGLRKESGYSWIEIGKDVSVFGVADNLHPENHLIYSMLHLLSLEMFDVRELDCLLI